MIIDLIGGVLLLLFGRSLFWLAVGLLGFFAGAQAASIFGPGSWWWLWAIGCGVIGAILAIAFEWVAIFWVGFVGGGYFLMNVFTPSSGHYAWGLFVVGGIAGVVVMALAFDWALIIISSLVGALLVARNVPLVSAQSLYVLFIVSLVLGVVVQALTLAAKNRSSSSD